MALRRITKELNDLWYGDPAAYISVSLVDEDNLFHWRAQVWAPDDDTPYANGTFYISIKFPQDYPFKPPKCKFETKIFHMQVNDKGGIKLNVLYDKWSPALNASKILLSIRSMLTDPDINNPLVKNIAELYKNDRILHDSIAREWTMKFGNNNALKKQFEQQLEKKKEIIKQYINIKDIFDVIMIYMGDGGIVIPKSGDYKYYNLEKQK
eukprot:473734_1